MAEYPFLSPMTGGGLPEMLAQIQRQNFAVKEGGLAALLEGLKRGTGALARHREIGRQREFQMDQTAREELFRKQQAEDQRAFLRRQAQDRYSVEGARQRRSEQELRRQFDLGRLDTVQGRIRDDLAAMERIAQSYSESGQQPPPQFAEMLNAMRQKVLGVAGPGVGATAGTPEAVSSGLAEGAARRIGGGGLDFSRGPLGMSKEPVAAPKQPPGAASKTQQSQTWARLIAGDPSVRAIVRGMSGVTPKRPEAAFYAKAAEALRANKMAGYPLTKAEVVEQLQDEIRKGAPSIEGIQKESLEPTPYLWGPAGSVILRRPGENPLRAQRFSPDAIAKELGGELTRHPAAARAIIGPAGYAGQPVFLRRTGEAAIRKHPAFSDDVIRAVIDQLASELGYGAE